MANKDVFEWLTSLATEPEVSSFSSVLGKNDSSHKRGQVLPFRKPETTTGDTDGE